MDHQILNQTTLLAWALGLCSGTLVALTHITLSLWIQKEQMNWRRAIRVLIFFPFVYVLLSGAVVSLTLNTSDMSLEEINQLLFFAYIVLFFSSSATSVSLHRHRANVTDREAPNR